jgi:hypothetical protein
MPIFKKINLCLFLAPNATDPATIQILLLNKLNLGMSDFLCGKKI